MRRSVVAIVGRPNVGKSTLFNRLCRNRSAIVDSEEGITRDRKYQVTDWSGYSFVIVDTGGIIPKSTDRIDRAVKFQAEVAIDEADVILFLVDVKTGITDVDNEVAKILSSHRDKVILVSNKVDNEKDELDVYDFLKLGFGDPFPIAAVHGRNVGNFLDLLLEYVNKVPHEYEKEDEDSIRVSIVGRPNVGKSSITNKLIGKDLNIVTDIPGTTRDSIDSEINHFGRKIIFVDTAGLRKKKKIKYGVEYFSTMRTIESINRSDQVLLVLDAEQEIGNQDQKIASYAARNFKDLIIIVNKWDLIKKNNETPGEFVKKIKRNLPFTQYAPIIFVSALTGQRIRKILDLMLEVDKESKKRIPTSELNRFLDKTVARFAPSHSSGKHTKIYYLTQVKTHPPTFVFFCNNARLVTKHYRKYLENQLREHFNFTGATIKALFRGRKEDESDN